MRIVNLEQFLQMPVGTLYAVGEPWSFGSVQVKQASLTNDWIYINPCGIENSDTGQWLDRLQEMKDQGASYPMDTATMRNGAFNNDAIFLVWERPDLIRLRAMVEEAISACPVPEPMGVKGAVQDTPLA